jgi:antitoxin (DNA-binding transcriptional repressor) of toxin-antitoxin stability system
MFFDMYANVQMSTITGMTRISVSEARATLPDLLYRVDQGEEVTITRHGIPIAVMVRPEALRARRTSKAFEGAAEIGRRLEAARRRPRTVGRRVSSEYAKEMVAEIRAGRDARP